MNIDETFALLERAAAAGERCPMGKPYGPINGHMFKLLVRAGKIESKVYGHNWRVVTILVGPHAGKSTQALQRSRRPDTHASMRRGPSVPRDYSGGAE